VSHDRYIDTAARLDELITAVRAEPLVAVDTEAASFHRYVDRVYLVQLSTRTATAIIDPLAVADLAPLGTLLGDAGVETVFHDADYDLRILDRDYGFRARRVFDTRIAAQLLGEPAVGLAALLDKHLGIKLSKTHQRADWSLRPLPAAMLAYAAADTRHLPSLRDALRDRLEASGRLTWAQEEFGRLEALRWSGPPDASQAYLRIKGARTLQPRQLAALRALTMWRDVLASEQDKATFRIIGNEALLAVSRALPRSLEALNGIRDLPAVLARRHGPALLAAVDRALSLPEQQLPHRERGPRVERDPELDQRVERLKHARNAVAESLKLDPGVLCAKATLESIARECPRTHDALAGIDGVRRWQVAVLGDALLSALNKPSGR
jgi:ribonuclease D